MKEKELKDILDEILSKTDHYEPGLGNLEKSDEKNIHYRNDAITEVVQEFKSEYSQTNTQRKSFRGIFFKVTMCLFSLLILFCIFIASYSVINFNTNELGSAAIVITALGTIITTVITLPKIIAKHLFPEDERDKSIDMIKAILESDLEMRKFWEYDKHKQDVK